eukprot:271111_1
MFKKFSIMMCSSKNGVNDNTHIWTEAPSIPFASNSNFIQILRVNDNEAIAITDQNIKIFNNKTNEWTYWRDHCMDPPPDACCIDNDNEQLILWLKNDYSISQIKYDHKAINTIASKVTNTGVGSSLIKIQSSLHLIGGSDNTKHYTFDTNNFSTSCMCDFRASGYWGNGNYYHGLIHIKSRQQLLLFGGFELGVRFGGNEILLYSLETNQWTKCVDAQLPTPLYAFAYIVTKDGTQLIIFGGNTGDDVSVDILIMSLDTMEIRKSKVTCRFFRIGQIQFDAVLLNEQRFDQALISGYLRLFCNGSYSIPLDVTGIIARMSSVDNVHLLSADEHWKLPLAAILES